MVFCVALKKKDALTNHKYIHIKELKKNLVTLCSKLYLLFELLADVARADFARARLALSAAVMEGAGDLAVKIFECVYN